MTSKTTAKLQADVDEKRDLVTHYFAARRRAKWSLIAAGAFAVTMPPVATFLPDFMLIMWSTMGVILLLSFIWNGTQYPSYQKILNERRHLLRLERLLFEAYLIEQKAEGLGMEL